MALPSVTSAGIVPAVIQHARVLDVNMASYTVTVATQYAKKPLADISFMVPYTHFNNGEGMYFLPEVGSLCWICKPSDGSNWFVLGWSAAQDERDFSARRQALNPGDMYLGTRDENFIWLRRGGVIQIAGGALCQRLFMPVNNTIADYCENYGLHTLGGDLDWTVGRDDSSTDGSRPTTFSLHARQKAGTEQPIAELEIGSHDGDDTTILSLKIHASEDKGAAEKITLKMGKDGTVTWDCESDVSWTVNGKWALKTSDDATVDSQKNISLTAQMAFTAKGGTTATMEAGAGDATVKSPSLINLNAPLTQAGGPAAVIPTALAVPLLVWLTAHVHQIILPVPGTPTSPPTVPPPPNIASTSLFAK